jgi:hypothetical protein
MFEALVSTMTMNGLPILSSVGKPFVTAVRIERPESYSGRAGSSRTRLAVRQALNLLRCTNGLVRAGRVVINCAHSHKCQFDLSEGAV